MNNHTAFISKFENHSEPLISLTTLINEFCQYTNKTPSQIADRLEKLLFGFRKGGSRDQYDNAFCYCSIFEREREGKIYTYEPQTNHFKDTFDHIKSKLNEVVALNSTEVLGLSDFSVRRYEIAQHIKKTDISLLNKSPTPATAQPPAISQLEADYISLYDLLEWAKPNYDNLSATATDLLRLLNGQNIQLYRHYTGIKKSIDKDNQKLAEILKSVKAYNSYEEPDFDIPF